MVGDGAVAAVLKKGEPTNQLLNYASRTDGSTVDCIKVPMGGTRHPYTQIEQGAPASASRLNYICVDDPEGLDRILSLTYLENYVEVINRAVEKSGHSLKDINFLFTNQVKRSLSHDIFQSVGLGEENTVSSIRDYGHMGTVDTLFNLAWEQC